MASKDEFISRILKGDFNLVKCKTLQLISLNTAATSSRATNIIADHTNTIVSYIITNRNRYENNYCLNKETKVLLNGDVIKLAPNLFTLINTKIAITERQDGRSTV